MPIVEFEPGDYKEFLKEMEEMLDREKSGPRRFKLFISSGNQRIVFQPQVTTSRVNTLLIRNFTSDDLNKIEQKARAKGVNIVHHWNFWFDERKEPPTKPIEERPKE